MSNWKPPKAIGSRVIIRPDAPDTHVPMRDESGLVLFSSAGVKLDIELMRPEQKHTGVILSMGRRALEDYPGLHVGQRVIFRVEDAEAWTHDGVDLIAGSMERACPHCKGGLRSDFIMGVV